jgi:D-tyrosyl-tRNA(Tyr) deacylase
MLSRAAILQRVASASVSVDSHLVSSIGKGVLVFAAVAADDTRKEVERMAAKVLKMKLWPDETGATVCWHWICTHRLNLTYLSQKWKNSVQDIKGEVLCGRQYGRNSFRSGS